MQIMEAVKYPYSKFLSFNISYIFHISEVPPTSCADRPILSSAKIKRKIIANLAAFTCKKKKITDTPNVREQGFTFHKRK